MNDNLSYQVNELSSEFFSKWHDGVVTILEVIQFCWPQLCNLPATEKNIVRYICTFHKRSRNDVRKMKITELADLLSDDLAKKQGRTQIPPPLELSKSESDIIEALGDKTLFGGEIAKIAGYPNNANFRSALSSLKKRGILGHRKSGHDRGYFIMTMSGQTF